MRVYTVDGEQHTFNAVREETRDGVLYLWRVEDENDSRDDWVIAAFPLTNVMRWDP